MSDAPKDAVKAPRTADDHEKSIRDMYGQYVATTVIRIDGARAFNPGDPVPVNHVKNGIVRSDQVKKKGA